MRAARSVAVLPTCRRSASSSSESGPTTAPPNSAPSSVRPERASTLNAHGVRALPVVRIVAGENVRALHPCAQEAPLARELVELQVGESEQADLVGLDAARERSWEARHAAAVPGVACAGGRVRDAGPRPSARCRPVPQLVVEHRAHDRDGTLITCVRVPLDEPGDEARVDRRRVVLPVAALQGLRVVRRVVEVHTALRVCVDWHALLEERPAEA